MSPLPQHQLSRRTISSEERYTVAFAVLGSVILACGVLWGYFIPKWRKKRERPVPTRYNCIGNGNNPKANRKVDSEHDLELPVIFPPHPAVVVPLSKKAESNAQPRVYNHTSILVYNPQIQSPFPNTPRPAVCRPLASEVLTKTVPPPSKAKSLHSARVQQSQPRIAAKSIHRLPLPTTPNPFQRQRIGNLAQHNNTKGDKRSLLVPRPAGAPPAKPPTARLASAKSKHEIPIWEDPVQLSSSPPNLISIGDYKNLKQGQGRAIASHPPGVQNKSANEISNSMNQSACTPAQASPGIRNIFETPSSLETCTTSRLDSFVKHGHAEFTPPTAPGSSALQIEVNNLYPGATKLVPSRRFKDYVPALKKTATPSTDTILEGSSTLLEEVHDSHQVPRDGNRPTSAPPSSSRQRRMIVGDLPVHPSLPGLDSITDIQLHRSRSPYSAGALSDSSELLPRPLTLRGTTTSQSPLVSPTPAGRNVKKKESPGDSLRRRLAHLRSTMHEKSPKAKRQIHRLRSRRRSGNEQAISESNTYATYEILEDNPFVDRFGLARLGGDRRRSSVASLSTLKIPKSFRSRMSRGGSSTYSRDTKGVSMLPSPGLGGKLSSPLRSLPRLKARRANSFDETIFQDLGWTPPFDGDSGNDVSLTFEANKENQKPVQGHPRSPTFSHNRQPTRRTPIDGTASSNTFGSRMPVPKISIARSSDDVFRNSSPTFSPLRTRRSRAESEDGDCNNAVVENGRMFKRIRAVESKLSHEDLIKYGRKTAPGGVEWF